MSEFKFLKGYVRDGLRSRSYNHMIIQSYISGVRRRQQQDLIRRRERLDEQINEELKRLRDEIGNFDENITVRSKLPRFVQKLDEMSMGKFFTLLIFGLLLLVYVIFLLKMFRLL